MGPFELMDLVGVDVNFEVAKSFWEQSFARAPLAAPPDPGADGRRRAAWAARAGRGYYDYGRRAAPARRSRAEPDAAAIRGWSQDHRASRPRCQLRRPCPTPCDAATLRRARATLGDDLGGRLEARARPYFSSIGKHVERVADAPGLVLGRILCQIVNEAHFAVGEGVATAEDVDTAMRLGFNWPRGPFEWAEAIGPARVVGVLDALRSELGEERYGWRRCFAAPPDGPLDRAARSEIRDQARDPPGARSSRS